MFATLVVAAALIRCNCVHSRGSNEDLLDSPHVAKLYSEDDMTPDFAEQLRTMYIKKRNDVAKGAKYGPPQKEVTSTTKPVAETSVKHSTARNLSEPMLRRKTPGRNSTGRPALEEGAKRHVLHEEIDVVDREDHVTQYLSDLLINTDSEITSLQASEIEEERDSVVEVKEDSFFAFLTGLEKAVEVEGARSRPSYDDVFLSKNEVQEIDFVSDIEYKD